MSSLPLIMDVCFHSGSDALLVFTAFDLTFTTRHIHNWALFLRWPNHFILSKAFGSFPLFFPSRILGTFQPGGLIFQCDINLPFHTVHGVLMERMLGCIAPSPSSGPCFVRTLHQDPPSWKALHRMAHCFIELSNPLHNNKAMIYEGVNLCTTLFLWFIHCLYYVFALTSNIFLPWIFSFLVKSFCFSP